MKVLSLAIDRLETGTRVTLASGPVRALYVAEGRARAEAPTAAATLAANTAWFGTDAVTLLAQEPTLALRFELADAPPHEPVALARQIPWDPARRYLLRADRVDFPPGGVAYLHTHQGPGLRCLLTGSIRIETDGHAAPYGPLGAWFEAGPEPVFAAASQSEPTAFARVMILPLELRGKSSIRYVREEDLTKPKPQSYQVFLDQPIPL